MAVPIVCGIETEYGIIVRRAEESNPIAASSTLVSAYVSDLAEQGRGVGRPHRVGWDFEDESPANDARGGANPYSYAPEVESHLVNAVLTNGSRYYVDHAHPELSTPECRTALQALLYDRAGEEILLRSMRVAPRFLPEGQEIVVYKNNSDGKGQSYGCHENYLLSRGLPFGRLITQATSHLVTRQIFCGAGKVGTEVSGQRRDTVSYQISQRADFFEEEVGLETTLKRPIINTRDEPHADARKYRRFHVIIGDANMSEVATLLKVGTTALWLAVIDDDAADKPLRFARPIPTLRAISTDLSLSEPIEMIDGTTMTALEVQWEIYRMCLAYAESHGLEAVGVDVGEMVLDRWRLILEGLESDPMSLVGQVDWIAKYRLLNGYRERHDLVGRCPAPGHGPAVPRPPPREVAGPPRRPRNDPQRCRCPARHRQPSARHPGVVPGHLPAAVPRRHRGRQLGLAGLRRGRVSAAPSADARAHPRHPRARWGPARQRRHRCRTARQARQLRAI